MLTRAVVRTCVHPAVHLFSRRHVPIRSSAAATQTALASHISLREDHIVVRAVSTSGMLRATTLYYECRAGRDFIRSGLALLDSTVGGPRILRTCVHALFLHRPGLSPLWHSALAEQVHEITTEV